MTTSVEDHIQGVLELTEDDILHYGVPGMKWGVRKSRDKKSTTAKTNSTSSTKTTPKNKPANLGSGGGYNPDELDSLIEEFGEEAVKAAEELRKLGKAEILLTDGTKHVIDTKGLQIETVIMIGDMLKGGGAFKPGDMDMIPQFDKYHKAGRETPAEKAANAKKHNDKTGVTKSIEKAIAKATKEGRLDTSGRKDGDVFNPDAKINVKVTERDDGSVMVTPNNHKEKKNKPKGKPALIKHSDVTSDELFAILDITEDDILHYGVPGMKWGVRKSRKGKVKARSTMNRKDRKDAKWIGNSNNDAYNKTYNKVFKKAARKVRGSIRRVNKDPRFKGQDFNKKSPLRDEYYKEINKAVTSQLNAASTLVGQSPNKRFEMRFDFNLTKSATPSASIRQVDTRKGRKEQRQEAKAVRRFKHDDMSDDVPWMELDVTFDELGHMTDINFGEDIEHSDFDVDGFLEDLEVESFIKQLEHSDVSVDELVAMVEMSDEDVLHYGVLGMRWGIRKDAFGRRKGKAIKGTNAATREGTKKRRKKAKKGSSEPEAPRREALTDDELRNLNNRIKMEQEYARLTAKQKSAVQTIIRDVVVPGLKEGGKEIIKTQLTKRGNALINDMINKK